MILFWWGGVGRYDEWFVIDECSMVATHGVDAMQRAWWDLRLRLTSGFF